MAGDEVLDRLLRESSREPVKLVDVSGVSCPACESKSMSVSEYMYSVPFFGNIVLSVGECSRCGYRYRDVRLAEATEPKKIIVRVEGEEQLRLLVARSPLSSIYIPEVGLEMIPSRASLGFITTVEGLLHRFHEVTSLACKEGGGEVDVEKCRSVLEWLERAIEGYERFTIVICDFDGLSKIVGGREVVKISVIDEECRSREPSL
ncbi:MAG: ZPR1 zinc finger domain-containing protein [Aeropyrum sp.]|nr:ZPR1 zinc finger domain-containing protein [Aeropyrum sp.]